MKKLIRFLLILALIITLILLYSRYIGTTGLITKEYKIETADIPNSFDGLKVIHFSDLHYLRVTNKETLQKVVDEINLINPDIVFFTGDLIDKDFELTEKDQTQLIELLKSINSKYGKYAVIGNHDYVKEEGLLQNIFDSSSFTLLQNSYDIIYSNKRYPRNHI